MPLKSITRALVLTILTIATAWGQNQITGIVLDDRGQLVPNAEVSIGQAKTKTDAEGRFSLPDQSGSITIHVSGSYIVPENETLSASDSHQNIEIHIHYTIGKQHESLVITATALDPSIDRRNGAVYKNTLFNRDDQLMDTLAAGINTGQHEGGGKSLEIRRFGYNLDHGGVNGGLKVLVDDVQQNQATQGHGQGYLGALKSLTPELIDDVDILNGPFSAEYGDFSGLGVVHIRLKETQPNKLMLRMQGGSFGGYRSLINYSPSLEHADTFISYEHAHTDGPFINPGRYGRDNVTGNYTWKISDKEALGFKLNFGRNDFYSSGQIPLDLVAEGQLDRFGFIDPFDGGKVRLGTLGTYYRKDLANGDIFKADGFLGRSLFDLYSNFTFFLNDPINGDEIQQHDSRLQEGVNTQYLHPYKLLGHQMLLTLGSNYHDNQINVGLLRTKDREFLNLDTSAHAHVTNTAGYLQQGADFWQGRLHFDAGLRYDYFRFRLDNALSPSDSGTQGEGRIQPKANLAYTPSTKIPLTLHASYGRGISSQDARGVIERPEAPKVATTDFYQLGTSHNLRRFSLSTDVFLINRSNEQVYIPDDGTFELKGPSRAYGWEGKTSIQLTSHLSFNGGFTQVSNAYYRQTFPREYVDSSPHSTANSGLTLSGWRGFNGSLRYRHISGYILDPVVRDIPRAAGLDVLDLSMSKQLRHNLEFNFAVDNLNNKRYWETQNYLESRVTPASDVIARVHGTPGYPIGVTVGLTFRLGEK
ncbi:MAG TPA: TonB-dependent receptor [Terriglobales bacterium]